MERVPLSCLIWTSHLQSGSNDHHWPCESGTKHMSKLRIFLAFVGGLLMVLGVMISLITIVSGAADIQPTISPFDQTDDMIVPERGVAPTIVPILHTDNLNSQGMETGRMPATTISSLTETPAPIWIPSRIVIPAIQLDAPIVSATLRTVAYQGKNYPQWKVPNFFAAGWAFTSASLGSSDNTVLFGHHNTEGEVFAHLVDLQVNDLIVVYAGSREFTYVVSLKMILPERDQPVNVRLQNASWILPSTDERLTLLTCWPYASNTHRLIIVAVPILVDNLRNYLPIMRLTPNIP